MAIGDEIALSKLIASIYTEVFQRRPSNPNKPLNTSNHPGYPQTMDDNVKAPLIASTVVYQWGPGGFSDETNATPQSARWSFTATWG